MKPDIKGLTKLANKLKRIPRKEFSMDQWWQKTPCGTKGCIAGWAAAFFPHRFKKVDEYTSYNEDTHSSDSKGYEIEHRSSGAYGSVGFAKGFKISCDQAEKLTLENVSTKRTPKAAAKAVMVLVGKLKKEMRG